SRNLLRVQMRFGVVTGDDGVNADFQERPFEVQLPPSLLKNDGVRARDMTWIELTDKREELEEELDGVAEQIKIRNLSQVTSGTPRNLAHEIKLLREKERHHQQLVRLIDVEKLMRPALSLGCLCFILVGCPVG